MTKRSSLSIRGSRSITRVHLHPPRHPLQTLLLLRTHLKKYSQTKLNNKLMFKVSNNRGNKLLTPFRSLKSQLITTEKGWPIYPVSPKRSKTVIKRINSTANTSSQALNLKDPIPNMILNRNLSNNQDRNNQAQVIIHTSLNLRLMEHLPGNQKEKRLWLK